ncbi:signal peptidase I [Mangrovibacillus cuniculi]|uniref:Signal peptidase I n=1 Tax=Mangrovibacillus cuniculi TaxID=2593652 RepID=A0A7S8HF84_9BACI|nr:signal peptidase I [Mangrovibacillus cuniculi]QPC46160.1 signal peptidase I [Mangrovibacillus cuniculi]
MRRKRYLKDKILFGILVVLLIPAFIVIFPYFFGWKSYVVTSGSMQPTIGEHSTVIVKPKEEEVITLGDIVLFQYKDSYVLHRVERIFVEENKVKYVTKGDDNPIKDNAILKEKDILGTYQYHLPFIGGTILWIQENFLMSVFLAFIFVKSFFELGKKDYVK